MTFAQDVDRAARQLKGMDKALDATLPPAARAGAQVFKSGAKRRAPRRTGDLENSIDDRAGERRRGYAEHVVFSDLFYAPLVEYGHGGGVVAPKDARALRIGGEFYARAQAGAASPRPFFRATADQDEGDIVDAIEKEVTRRVNRVL